MVGTPMPRMIATNIAKIMARKVEAPATSSSMVAKRPPTPVTPMTPATMPAAAQTAMSCIISFIEPCSVA